MLPDEEKRCKKCSGWGILWNEAFDKKLDRITDSQGLSYYDAVLQLKKSSSYKKTYSNCGACKGIGEIAD
ncbi:hypothetical protein N780_10235 [Pontibacillus chungwhensis BH030062]|uniref:Uncharacterized protein n=1 Tax=Pontibacillus chungwhensis BH030062 TaxID=1385513 RepID=A0A0A2USA7_9BACI|nr:hypothetical protein [Pontibacillus chungwhensis]KGP89658.1 hypothetical protein N780_10235 [Pontibacillus chungwhensis BH030062]